MQDKLSRPHRYTSHRAKSPCNEPHMSLTRGTRGIVRHLAQFEQEVLNTENVIFIHSYTYTHSYANVHEESLFNPSRNFKAL
jgi:hypothetical protein